MAKQLIDSLPWPEMNASQRGVNIREEIVGLLRGQISCPIISCLGELGWIARMIDGPFDQTSFGTSVEPRVFRSLMVYLTSIGLVTPTKNDSGRFTLTEVGAKVLSRFGAFCILNSYEPYMQHFKSLLTADSSTRVAVNRERNVIGSGALHGRKFFRPALELLGSEPYDYFADVGCGDGQFLINCHSNYPHAALLGVDLSPLAVGRTLQRIRSLGDDVSVDGCVCDGVDIAIWSQQLCTPAATGRRVLISFWFLLHEFSRSDPAIIIQFFESLRRFCPRAHVLVGEVVRTPEEVLAQGRASSISILPELTLLHDLSGQGLLDWQQWQRVLRSIPYALKQEKQFDLITGPGGMTQPSAAIWLLVPKEL